MRSSDWGDVAKQLADAAAAARWLLGVLVWFSVFNMLIFAEYSFQYF